MGHWGEGPWDGDRAIDFAVEVYDYLIKKMQNCDSIDILFASLDIYMNLPEPDSRSLYFLTGNDEDEDFYIIEPFLQKLETMVIEESENWADPMLRRSTVDNYIKTWREKIKDNIL